MDILTTVERRTLFSITRVLALVAMAGLALGILAGLYLAVIGTVRTPSDKATAEEVFQSLGAPAPQRAAGADLNPLAGLKLPEQQVFKGWIVNDQIRPLIENQLNFIEKRDRQGFLDELGRVLAQAEREQKSPALAAQRFFALSEKARAARKNAAAERSLEKDRAVYGIGVGLGLLALFSLVLVLLAIERNTRAQA